MTYLPAGMQKFGNAALTSIEYVLIYDPATDVPTKVTLRDFAAFIVTPAAKLHPYGHAPNPMPTVKLDLLRVGANQQFGEVADAAAWANPGATILVDDGAYYAPFHTAVPNLTIRSVSGNPYKCYLDGEGGNGGGKRLAYGKGMIHCGDATSIAGVGFQRCGGVNGVINQDSSEAGVYGEGFPVLGTLALTRCSFDNCGNGVFIPQIQSNIKYVETECVFAYLGPNSQSNPLDAGPSHDRYITPASVVIDGSYSYGNTNGHAIKCEALTLTVKNCPWIAAWGGRAIEPAYGGAATVTNSTLISRNDNLPSGKSAVGNFLGYADQNINNFAATGSVFSFDGCTFLIGRAPSVILMPNGGTLNFTNGTVKYFDMGGAFGMGYMSQDTTTSPSTNGVINGLSLTRPAAGDPSIIARPVAPPPPVWAFTGAPPPAATAATAPSPVPTSAKVGAIVFGPASALTPAGAMAWACLHDGAADVGTRVSFGGPAIPNLVPATATATHTIRVYDSATGGTLLATSATFSVSP